MNADLALSLEQISWPKNFWFLDSIVPDSVPKDQKCNIKYYVSMNGPQEKVTGFKIKDRSLASLPPLSRLVSWKLFRESSEPNLGAPNIQ
jgi:hypothetical protein